MFGQFIESANFCQFFFRNLVRIKKLLPLAARESGMPFR
jgi:hypothetical protein